MGSVNRDDEGIFISNMTASLNLSSKLHGVRGWKMINFMSSISPKEVSKRQGM
jgi:hypothetical protein